MKTIIIARVSHTDSSQDPSPQLAALREYCVTHGHEVVGSYGSQESVRTGRSSYAPILKLIEDHSEAELLLFTEVCRISRKLSDLLSFIDTIHAKGIGILIKGMSPTMVDKKVNRNVMFMIHMLGATAEFDNAQRSDRISLGRAHGSKAVRRKSYCGTLDISSCRCVYALYKKRWIDEIRTIKATAENLANMYNIPRSTMAKFLADVNKCGSIEKYIVKIDKFNQTQDWLTEEAKAKKA